MTKTFELTVIELDSRGLHICIQGKLHNQDVLFIIDTGASNTVLNSTLLSEDSYTIIQTDGIESSQLTETFEGSIISVPTITLHNWDFEDITALSMSLDHINSIYGAFSPLPIAGLIGGDFLQKYKAEISYSKQTVSLEI